MTLIRFTSAAMARSRFALSPLAETLAALIALDQGYTAAWIAPWVRAHRPDYLVWRDADPVRGGLLRLVATTKWFPQAYGVVPRDGLGTRLDAELECVAAHRDDDVRADLRRSAAASTRTHDLGWLDATDLAATMAATAREGWARFVEPTWPRRRTVMERDIARRAGLLAAYGWREATAGMTRHAEWVEVDALRFSHQGFDDLVVGDDGLVFVPHTTGVGSWTCDEPPRHALVYPASGAGAAVAPPVAASTLLGAGRATVLHELRSPATPSELAAALGVSLGTVSGHLAVLRSAGVVEGVRAGRSVRYVLTVRGRALLDALAT